MNRRSIKHLGKWIIGTAIVVFIVGYALFTSKSLIKGPEIELLSPQNGATVASSTVVISGNALRVQSISLNGRPLTVDEQGGFSEVMLVSKGYNAFLLTAEDRFRRKTERLVEVMGDIK